MPAQTNATTTAEIVAKVLFYIFVYIADSDDGLTAREIERLIEIMDNPVDNPSPVVQQGLVVLSNKYADFWKDYQRNSAIRSIESVKTHMLQLQQIVSKAECETLSPGLKYFIAAFTDKLSPILSRLGLSAVTPAKKQAITEIDRLFAQCRKEATDELTTSIPLQEASPAEQSLPVENPCALWPAAALTPAVENVLPRGRTRARCVAVIPETHDVKTFIFESIPARLIQYKPGQFITLDLPINGKTVKRSYTISSSPSRPHVLSITVKRVPDGLASNWLHDNVQAGFELFIAGPNGEFNCFDAPANKLLLISAGSGITPVMSMLRWLTDTFSSCNIVFLNNVRTPIDIIFDHELRYLGQRLGDRLKLGLIPAKVDAGQYWNGPVGHFSLDLVKLYAPDFLEREVFVCGPSGYMDMVRTTLENAGFPMAHYHQESFGGAPITPRPAVAPSHQPVVAATVKPVPPPIPAQPTPNMASATISIEFAKSGKTLTCSVDDFILDLAEANGLTLSSSCRSGTCGTCKIKKIEGDVEMDGQQALTPTDLSDGYVLACVGRACSKKVVLDA